MDAVSEMYVIFPSGATTKAKPCSVCNKQEPSSLIGVSLGFGTADIAPHASPKPANKEVSPVLSIQCYHQVLKSLGVLK